MKTHKYSLTILLTGLLIFITFVYCGQEAKTTPQRQAVFPGNEYPIVKIIKNIDGNEYVIRKTPFRIPQDANYEETEEYMIVARMSFIEAYYDDYILYIEGSTFDNIETSNDYIELVDFVKNYFRDELVDTGKVSADDWEVIWEIRCDSRNAIAWVCFWTGTDFLGIGTPDGIHSICHYVPRSLQ